MKEPSMSSKHHVDPIAEVRRQWSQRQLPAADEMLAVGLLMRVHQLLLAELEAQLRPLDLSFARYEALLLLHFSAHGELPLGKMGERLLVHPTSVTGTVDRLEAQGLVERVQNPSDRRSVLARITPEGRKKADEAIEVMANARFGLAGWSKSSLGELAGQLQKLRESHDDSPSS